VNHGAMIWTLAILALIVIGWYVFEGRWDQRLFKAEAGRLCVNVRPREAKAFLEAHPDTQVLDVRSDAEFGSGALPGAIHLSIGDAAFARKIAGLDREKPVLVYCAGGFRSRKAAAILKTQGFMNIQHLHRGYHSWKLAGLPVVRSGVG
ncbi:MAG: rhodanese-like domain-containing protein, partial [Prosthecobacter sp.]|nr:rhodanese-like domain-containing protein [Prosthecobacter sp.]